jgi:O-6-methylguanine DNA methyltransferase
MNQASYCLFETPLGWCGIAWREQEGCDNQPVVTLFQLPQATKSKTEARIARAAGASGPSSPPSEVAVVIKRVCMHFEGQPQDFQDIPIDLNGVGSFARQVYQAARRIPIGQTMTYGELAKAARRPGAARAVGQALGKNPIALIIPCHRILAAGGKAGGFSAFGGKTTKAKMLAIEGAGFLA